MRINELHNALEYEQRPAHKSLEARVKATQADLDRQVRQLLVTRQQRLVEGKALLAIDRDLAHLHRLGDELKTMADQLRPACATCRRWGFRCNHDGSWMPAPRAIAQGGAIKSLAAGDDFASVGGYLIRYGTLASPGDLSEMRDIFRPPPETNYGSRQLVDALVHHGNLRSFGAQKLTNPAELVFDRVGVFVRHLLSMRDEYEKALADLVRRGKLAWSSGAERGTVTRKALAGGRHLITNWEITEASYTPWPAEPENLVAPL